MATRKTWAKIQPLKESINLAEIIAEQFVERMQQKKLNKQLYKDNRYKLKEDRRKIEIYKESNELIAYKLQNQFYQKYNTYSKWTEETINHHSKNKNETDLNDENRDIDHFVSIEKLKASIPHCGYKRIGDRIITKHDILMCSRLNVCRVLQFPPGINTGDTGAFDVKINNVVFNNLKKHYYTQIQKNKISTKLKNCSKYHDN